MSGAEFTHTLRICKYRPKFFNHNINCLLSYLLIYCSIFTLFLWSLQPRHVALAYSSGPMAANGLLVPYLKQILGFIGIADIETIRADAQSFGTEASEKGAAAQIANVEMKEHALG